MTIISLTKLNHICEEYYFSVFILYIRQEYHRRKIITRLYKKNSLYGYRIGSPFRRGNRYINMSNCIIIHCSKIIHTVLSYCFKKISFLILLLGVIRMTCHAGLHRNQIYIYFWDHVPYMQGTREALLQMHCRTHSLTCKEDVSLVGRSLLPFRLEERVALVQQH